MGTQLEQHSHASYVRTVHFVSNMLFKTEILFLHYSLVRIGGAKAA